MKDHLVQQFSACWDKNIWFVALKNTLEGVTAEVAGWKPNGTVNSIREMINHLRFYNYAYYERFKGEDYVYPVDENDATFAADGILSEEVWQEETAKLNAVMNEFRDLIKKAEEAKFEEPVSESNPATWASLISNINAHNAYHGGQILLMRKLRDDWNREKGVS
jgi:uncharacterized damage-inducible protein DinB